ncbi:MAG: 2-hydroxyacid dehydrogenase [Bdellovibrionaceae bacterium]|nr:2-hydroxyacid dehydrogenase [Bdellovibrionales bacterium]MCB9253166.1 2-hydroxyacid dehydrogenase [Pseudobdellovibrionaceae bacterium]
MKFLMFDTHRFERQSFELANRDFGHDLHFVEPRLTEETAVLAKGFPAVCAFANDRLNRTTLEDLKNCGVELVALRSAGFNHVDLSAAKELGLRVVRVPEYSPYSVAEHATCLLLSLDRKVHRAYNRVREMNFSLDGLVGFDLHGKTVGVIGTGKIGRVFCQIMLGFGCQVVAYDLKKDADLEKKGVTYLELNNLFQTSDVISLHIPLNAETKHLVDAAAISQMKKGVVLINTGRGALIDTKALIQALKAEHLGGAGLDVYEEEEKIFFQDLSEHILQDDQLARLLTFPNVLITSHQGFLTREALANIAHTTLNNIADYEAGRPLVNEVAVT